MMADEEYRSPLTERYASVQMSRLFSDAHRFRLWRRLWLALAEAQKELGLPITDEQIAELRAFQDRLNLERASEYEQIMQHDVMAHIHAFGEQCPKAKAILHLGATSSFVKDNADLLIFKEALLLLKTKLIQALKLLGAFASKYKDLACLGQTHLQPAQPTTVGKRACLWAQDLLLDLQEIKRREKTLRFLGMKGATGTQSSSLQLFDKDTNKALELDRLVAVKMDFTDLWQITGQTYPRKVDSLIAQAVSGIAISAEKFAVDIRLLCSQKEFTEPRAFRQVGSSAMPHKRNPIYSERISALARFARSLAQNASETAGVQWLERSLDDSANRRLSLPQLFLTVDAILELVALVAEGLTVHTSLISSRLQQELPFLALESFLLQASKKGKDRQELHEHLRQHSLAAEERVAQGSKNDLLVRIANDPLFGFSEETLQNALDSAALIGRASLQVQDFLDHELWPALQE